MTADAGDSRGAGDLATLGGRPLSPQDPAMVGRYRIHALLGIGGMGRVYLGWTQNPGFGPSRDGAWVAVKVIRPDLADNAEFRRRFARELETVGRVRTPYAAALVQGDAEAQQPWMATEFVPGVALADAVQGGRPLPAASVWRLAHDLGNALVAVHQAGIVHRDVKPSNVILNTGGAKIIDFGVAHASDLSQLTATGMNIGTPSYMAPEQAKTGDVSPASDMFSLGVLLYFAATGRLPFGEGGTADVLFRVVYEEPDLSGLADLEPQLRDLVLRCMAKDPLQRPNAAGVVAMAQTAAGTGAWSPNDAVQWPQALAAQIRERTVAAGRTLPDPSLEEPTQTAPASRQALRISQLEQDGRLQQQSAYPPHERSSHPAPHEQAAHSAPHDQAAYSAALEQSAYSEPNGESPFSASREQAAYSASRQQLSQPQVPVQPQAPSAQVFPAPPPILPPVDSEPTVFTGSPPGRPGAGGPERAEANGRKHKGVLAATISTLAVLALGVTGYVVLGPGSGTSANAANGTGAAGANGAAPAGASESALSSASASVTASGSGSSKAGSSASPAASESASSTSAAASGSTRGVSGVASSGSAGQQTTAAAATSAPAPTSAAPSPSGSPNPYTAAQACGSDFQSVASHSISGATIYLYYSNSAGENCVVTLATTVYGKVSMRATLEVEGGSTVSDSGNYTYYAGPVKEAASGKCVIFGGSYNGQAWSSGSWNYCGS